MTTPARSFAPLETKSQTTSRLAVRLGSEQRLVGAVAESTPR